MPRVATPHAGNLGLRARARLLAEASGRVAAIDELMIADLTEPERLDLLDYLGRCITQLEGRVDPPTPA
ncbi:hypothetical protein GCM10011372_30000 [Agromyces bauzanensis]|uniref:MarR family transcriptional regulator n=1 Tax=Agromyces bauzanensis TaxID=1308924 RepID=A0A917PSF8_9MICO|nr:hypothetical protein GCM10011372_30000 [Agromyces bauzanensis]